MAHQRRHIMGHAWHCSTIFFLITNLLNSLIGLENCSMLYVVVCRPQWLAVFHYRNMDQLSVDRLWRLAGVNRNLARRNVMDSTGVTSVVSLCATVNAMYSTGVTSVVSLCATVNAMYSTGVTSVVSLCATVNAMKNAADKF